MKPSLMTMVKPKSQETGVATSLGAQSAAGRNDEIRDMLRTQVQQKDDCTSVRDECVSGSIRSSGQSQW